jgi:excisionase family DNA binding protein
MQQKDVQPIAVGAREASEMLGISITTLTKLTQSGELPCYRLFGDKGERFYPVSALKDFVVRRIEFYADQAPLAPESESVLPSVEEPSRD